MRTIHLSPMDRAIAADLEMSEVEYAANIALSQDAEPMIAPLADILRPRRRALSAKDRRTVYKIVEAFHAAGWRAPEAETSQ